MLISIRGLFRLKTGVTQLQYSNMLSCFAIYYSSKSKQQPMAEDPRRKQLCWTSNIIIWISPVDLLP